MHTSRRNNIGAVLGLKMGSLSSPAMTSYRLPMVTIGLSLTIFAVLQLVADGRTGGIGLAKGGNFIGRQTVELCTEIDHWFIQQSVATVQRSKERATIGFYCSEFFYFPLSANISTAAAVGGESDDSDVVAGDASYFSSSSLLSLLSSVSHNAFV